MKIAVTGATGFVGSYLIAKLQERQHEIVALCRNVERGRAMFPVANFPGVEVVSYIAGTGGEWEEKLGGCEAVINLAGEPIASRWNAKYKQEIINSRQLGTAKLVEAITKADPKPALLINSSAIGYYGTSETATFVESSPSGKDFLAEVCQGWEAAAQKVTEAGVRLVILRTGIVLGNGGAIAKMIPPFRLFAGGPIGSGNQWFSWIHLEDLVNLILEALDRPDIDGVLNATAPNPVRMTEFCQTLGDVMNRPSWLPVPKFAIETLLGDAAIVVLEGQEVQPKRTLAYGFTYKYPTVKQALKEVLG
jgi:uncharacterized protein (TIGR01777 family)